ncbi:alpha/beta fold hydrolase [Paenibacillus sp. Soil522]|uniref:alpha/beta fold hydrolase n=1 Tax=Paenibacillus sp. Soil522 TaxID=1736388 RepID=UPI0006F56BCA|nr:alpha/beta hydrolase [Paenibacillus sp. Soil522]KRE47840.1 hypothetical protein ASG81_07945 [Paenibacillus sp. Soil522]
MLPGIFSGADCLLPLADELKGHHVWVADLPGFGRSPYHHAANVIEGHVHAIIEAIASQPEQVTLIGHSYGALLAAKVMEQIPECIHAVLLMQPVLHPAGSRYKSRLINRMLLPQVTNDILRKELISRGCFEHANAIPHSYAVYAQNELSSPRVRATLADTLAALSRPSISGFGRRAGINVKSACCGGRRISHIRFLQPINPSLLHSSRTVTTFRSRIRRKLRSCCSAQGFSSGEAASRMFEQRNRKKVPNRLVWDPC